MGAPGAGEAAPVEVALDPGERVLEIVWSDGRRSQYGFDELRAACPCAGCRESRGTDPGAFHVLGPKDRGSGRVDLLRVTPVGRYGLNLRFTDGHASGIYTFDLLRELDRGAPGMERGPAGPANGPA